MKKTLLLAIGIFTAYLSQAQVTFGAKAGFNLSSVKGKDVEGTSSLPGFHVGVLAGIPLNDVLNLQPELFYSAEGAKMKTVFPGDGDELIEGKASAHLNYLNLPVLLQYHHTSGFAVQSGPQFGYLLSAKVKANGESSDIKDQFKKTNLSWVLGVSYLIPDNNIGFNIRYNFGITKLGKAEDGETAKAFGRTLQAGVFYMFK
ncbi:MAG: PorT family protein [Bacteroidetes bacterium]|nr:PorT family protein [Bacteroidota bacterium]